MPTGSHVTTSTHYSGQSQRTSVAGARVDSAYREQERRKRAVHEERIRQIFWHTVIFCVTFVFTTGFLALGVLLWVRPEALMVLIIIGIMTSGVFVATFATLRIIVLQRLYPGPSFLEEEDRSQEYHIGTGVAYGFIALVIAFFLAGVLMNVATAFTL
jgi:hypothetical protein